MWENLGFGAGGGIFGAFFSYLGFKREVNDIKEDVKHLQDNVVYEDTCHSITKGMNDKFEIMMGMQKEMRADIKEILKNTNGKK